MKLDALPRTARVFIDANIFVYHLDAASPYQPTCSAFLRRIETEAIRAVTSTLVVDEVIYAILIHEGSQLLHTDRLTIIGPPVGARHRAQNRARSPDWCLAPIWAAPIGRSDRI